MAVSYVGIFVGIEKPFVTGLYPGRGNQRILP
jgi:hypothetical protein